MIHEKITIQVPGYSHQAELYTYFLGRSPEMRPERKRPLVLICPGGGYVMTSDREAEPVAMKRLRDSCRRIRPRCGACRSGKNAQGRRLG